MATKPEITVDSNKGPMIRAFEPWVESVGKTRETGWRWRKAGMIETINIAGRVYVTDEAIHRFITRAANGEFSKVHKAPKRSKAVLP